MRGLATLIMRGSPMAALVAAVSGVLALLMPPLALIGGAAVALVTLRRGPQQGLLVLVLATAGGSLLSGRFHQGCHGNGQYRQGHQDFEQRKALLLHPESCRSIWPTSRA